MSFEVLDKDLLGRIGRLKTPHGTLETPLLFPVVNPLKAELTPNDIIKAGFSALITNAYIIMRRYGEDAKRLKLHGILNVKCPIMTDSGAYQILSYGYVQADPDEILLYQKSIGSDIGVILDVPSRLNEDLSEAAARVYETLRRARRAMLLKPILGDMLLVAPVQGAPHMNLVSFSAKKLAELDFDIYAVGGPTQYLEEYMFKEVAELIFHVRLNIPLSKPLHLFGAGHPLVLPLAVALGCDLFDSASYILYARDERYITHYGTLRLKDLKYFPCSCPICIKYTPAEVREMDYSDRVRLLALHNLYILREEISSIKEAIREGRLWEMLELKCRAHPSIMKAFQLFKRYAKYIEKYSVSTKATIRGIFLLSSLSVYRPEVLRHKSRLLENYAKRKRVKYIILLPALEEKPFINSHLIKILLKRITAVENDKLNYVNICIYNEFFGVIPIEVSEVFPLSQYESIKLQECKSIEEEFEKFLYKYIISIAKLQENKINIIVCCTEDFFYKIFEKISYKLRRAGNKVSVTIIKTSGSSLEKVIDLIVKFILEN
ncbi:MAG: tRNA guanosine(15) transglycosylase TgtA [Thermoprotei archaeon]|nr:MAG: tRNA guanosine(15) transglycosylase TgtA [Thermoprotei archaeon]RLE98882.1 MAG: tRNA guanosine(15) transglycosylase TgtA [Thermoprotei archaeon]